VAENEWLRAPAPQLHWLPSLLNWTERLKQLDSNDANAWEELVALSGCKIDLVDTMRLDRKLTQLFGKGAPQAVGTKPVRMAFLASSTVDHLKPAMRVGALRRRIWLDIFTPAYGQYSSDLRDSQSALFAYRPDCILFALDAQHLLAGVDPSSPRNAVNAEVERIIADLRQNWRLARDAFGCAIIQQTLLPTFLPLMGNNEHRLAGSGANVVQILNQQLRTASDEEGVDLLALDTRASEDGFYAWHDPALWFRAKQEVHPAAAPIYGDLLGRLLAARQGRSSKCLVLDLDNTIWGGVIGDDGLDGIVLGQGSAKGEAFTAFQVYVRNLLRRGVILAVCSKNDEKNAFDAFDNHPEMILRRSDIACFVANWSDKPSNIRSIAQALNIGLDALVFADDNPFEREIVRRELPTVLVPELPEDPSLYGRCIADAGYFEGVTVTAEDFERASQYRANIEREGLKTSATDLEGYLRSLNMTLTWARFDSVGLPRIVQLINKTNQFNLTTQRYSETEVVAVMADDRALSLQLRLADRVGDNGMISIVIGQLATGSKDMLIDTWLMSCRVLGRQVEQATLNLVAQEALRIGADRLIGTYRPTAKNSMVMDHYRKLGFECIEETDGGETRWALDLAQFFPKETIMSVVPANR
jgi:FkbH-like protein